MFKATLAEPKLLKSSIDAISNMIDEAGITVSGEGMRLRAMDPAHVALVDFELSKEACESLEVKEPCVLPPISRLFAVSLLEPLELPVAPTAASRYIFVLEAPSRTITR